MGYMHVQFGWNWYATQMLGACGIALVHIALLMWWPKRWMSWVLLVHVGCLVLYAIANTVYIPIFHNVLPLYFLEDNDFASSMIVDFYRTIPLFTYILSLAYIGAILWLYRLTHQHIPEQVSIRSKEFHRKELALFMTLIAFISIVAVKSVSATDVQYTKESQGIALTFFDEIYNQYVATAKIMSTETEAGPFLSIRQVEKGSAPQLSTTTPHIIIYQLESVPAWALKYGIEAMPFLTSLQERSLSIEHTYPNGCHTIDAEFTILCSQYPHSYRPIASIGTEHEYKCLPHILKEKGYTNAGFHINEPHFWSRDKLFPAWGIEELFFVPDAFETPKLDDMEMVDKAMDYLDAHKENPQFMYLVGYSSHAPHIFREMEYLREVSGTDIDFYDGPLDESLVSRVDVPKEGDIRAYMGFMEPVDRAIEQLFTRLEAEQLDDNTIVVITGDHRYYGFNDHLENKENFIDMNQVPLMIVFPEGQGGSDHRLMSHIDIAPTLLHAMEGDTYTSREYFLGESVFRGSDGDEVIMTCDKSINAITHEGEIGYTHQDDVFAASVTKSPLWTGEEREERILQLREYVLGHNVLVESGRLYE